MAGRLSAYAHMNLSSTLNGPPHHKRNIFFAFVAERSQLLARGRMRVRRSGPSVIRASNGGDSYLDMWKRAKDQERKTDEFGSIVQNSPANGNNDVVGDSEESPEALERKSQLFKKLQEIPKEERDRVQRMQVIDRAAAAIAAARALLKESPPPIKADSSVDSVSSGVDISKTGNNGATEKIHQQGLRDGSLSVSQSENFGAGTPGPNFWTWTPPPLDSNRSSEDAGTSNMAKNSAPNPSTTNSVMEKQRSMDYLSIPFESTYPESDHTPPLPPLQSLVEAERIDVTDKNLEVPSLGGEQELGVLFSSHAAEAAHALDEVTEASVKVNPDGSRWWKETGIEQRDNGVVCRWTLKRGVSADESVEWEEKFWEATGPFEYKELGSEKSGRDAAGNVWREFWKESMWQDLTSGLMHMEKTADKWGKDGNSTEWHEKWWEHYDASGQAEKWAHKWCSIDPNTPLERGHAHVWHERWGENYDGQGGSMKYTDKWAECCEGDGWSKWGDKWDEHFDPNGHGIKQGEKWWEGKHGERWNRTWGEGHNGSGWIHKYGKSSSGEHWDTHVQQETWYERYPHFGFDHCFENSVQLREVRKLHEKS